MEKVASLYDRLERIQLARANAPEPDALSISLLQMEHEMAALDDEGIAALAAEVDEDGR